MFDLPTVPAPRVHDPYLIEFGEIQTPFLGGEDKKVSRLGSRLGLKCELPRMTYETAMAWIAALLRAADEECSMRFRQPGFDPGNPAPLAAGATVANTFHLPVVGDYPIRPGQFFNIVKGDRRYLHAYVAPGAAGVWRIAPLLRVDLVGGELIELAQPVIQGFIPSDKTWNVERAVHAGLSFEIKESK